MLQYQPKLYQIWPSAYGVDATFIRIGVGGGRGGGGGGVGVGGGGGGGGNNRKVPTFSVMLS